MDKSGGLEKCRLGLEEPVPRKRQASTRCRYVAIFERRSHQQSSAPGNRVVERLDSGSIVRPSQRERLVGELAELSGAADWSLSKRRSGRSRVPLGGTACQHLAFYLGRRLTLIVVKKTQELEPGNE
jgi:hypothetical protein